MTTATKAVAEAVPESPVEAAPVTPPTREDLIKEMQAEVAAFEADKRKIYALIRTLRGTYSYGGSSAQRLLTRADMEGATTTPMLRGASLTAVVTVKGFDPDLYSERGLVVKLEELRAKHKKVCEEVRLAACAHASAGYLGKEALDEMFKAAGWEPSAIATRLEIARNAWQLVTSRTYDGSHNAAAEDFKKRFAQFLVDNDYTAPTETTNLSDIYTSQSYA